MNNIDYCNTINELLRSIDTKLAKVTNQHYSQQKLTAPQINILMLLQQRGPMRVSDIASELNMVDSNVSAICSRLENMEMIDRIRLKDDQRVVQIQLSQSAHGRMKDVADRVTKFQRAIAKNATDKDFDDIVNGLTKLNKLLDRALEEEE